MTQDPFFNDLRIAISDGRVEPYRRVLPQSDTTAYANYAWNVALCESIYPTLNGFEIALRNSIHSAATNRFGSEYWFNGRLKKEEEERLTALRSRMSVSGNKLPYCRRIGQWS